MDETDYVDADRNNVGKVTADDYDSAWALDINRKITYFSITPIAVTGIVLNIIIIFTWRKYSSSYHAAIFLFKASSVVNIVYLGGFCLWYYSEPYSTHKLILRGLAYSARNMVVNINFLMTVVRWIAVKHPFRFRVLSSAFRIRVTLASIIVYCALVNFLEILMISINVPIQVQKIVTVTLDQINLTLPLIAQFALAIGIVWLTWREQRKVKSSSGGVINRPTFSRQKISTKIASSRNRRLTTIIISISMMSFLAYPMGITTITYFRVTKSPPNMSFKRIVFACINLLHVINSTVDFFFFYAFMPEFRKYFQQLFCYCCKGVSPEQDHRPNFRATTMTTDIENPRNSESPSLAEMFKTPIDVIEKIY